MPSNSLKTAVLAHLRSEQLDIRAKYAEFKARVELERALATTKPSQLQAEQNIANQKEKQTQLTAPVAGIIQQLAIHSVGGVVTSAQPLMIVVPQADANSATVTAEVTIANQDIGFVNPGQAAEVKIETFSYTKYGTVKAKVDIVTADAVTDEKRGTDGKTAPGGAVYPAILALRQQTLSNLGVPVIDTYSSEEAGVLALQCPQSAPASPVYHTMAEGVIVEIVRSDGRPCQPGETGRVVVTDLLNFASPMIRYDIGDYAELGPVCSCGRGLPTLGRILGRLRNMVKLPGGKTNWPLTGFRAFSTIAPVTQYQFIQKSLELIEIRLVVGGAVLTPNQETAFAELVSRSLGHVFTYHFVYFAGHLPKPASGKFEEFVCEC